MKTAWEWQWAALWRRQKNHCLIAVMLASTSGCAATTCLQDWHFSHSNKRRANCAWTDHYSSETRKIISVDFENGYKSGYYDTAMGKDCQLPPVAPPKYWAAKYQTCSGRIATEHWFAGYQTGINHAQADGRYSNAAVPASPNAPVLNQSGCGACYSPDGCRCGSNEGEITGNQVENLSEPSAVFLSPAEIPVPVTSFPLDQFSSRVHVMGTHRMDEFPYDTTLPIEEPRIAEDVLGSSTTVPASVSVQGPDIADGDGLIGGYGAGVRR